MTGRLEPTSEVTQPAIPFASPRDQDDIRNQSINRFQNHIALDRSMIENLSSATDMNDHIQIPFQAAQMVEARSFLKGYRAAWFRCKIKNTRTRRGFLQCHLEYSDFPDEKIKWSNVYEVPPKDSAASSSLKQRKKELMLRPSFPPFHKESQLPPQHSPAEVRAVLNDAWRVGDLVDLWCDGCFWSGKIIKLHAVDSVEVELPGPPVGEGGVYKGLLKDLRPSLSWSLEKGWSVPISQANEDSWCTARLVQQPLWRSLNESDQSTGAAGIASDPSYSVLESRKEAPATSYTLSGDSDPNSLCFTRDNCNPKSRSVVTWDLTDTSFRNHNDQTSKDISSSSGQQNFRGRKSPEEQPVIDMIDESIMELEEVVNKIGWLKGLLQFGFAWSNDMRPS